jgi:hypothetical protein
LIFSNKIVEIRNMCKYYSFNKTTIIDFEVDISSWSEIENLVDSDQIMELPDGTNINLMLYDSSFSGVGIPYNEKRISHYM